MIPAGKLSFMLYKKVKNNITPRAAEEKEEATIWQNFLSINRISPK